MSAQPVASTRRRRFQSVSVNVDVDVDIDQDLLEENGYHHEDDCPVEELAGMGDNLRALSDWHDDAHGLSLWAHCVQAPCNILTDEFRSTP